MSERSKWLLIIIFGGLALITGIMLWNMKTLGNDLPGKIGDPLKAKTLDNWKSFQSDRNNFKVSVPSMPQHASEFTKDPKTGHQRKYDTYVSLTDDGSIYIISLITFSNESGEPSSSTLKELVNDMVKADPKNKLIFMKDETFNGKPDVNFNIENDQYHIRGISFFVDKTLYALTYTSTVDTYDEKDFEHFVESFQLSPIPNK